MPRSLLAAVCLIGLVLAPARAQTRLEWKFSAGDRFFVETVDTRIRKTADSKSEIEITTIDGYKVLKQDAGGVVLEKTTVALKLRNPSNPETEKFAETLAKKLQGFVLTLAFEPGMHKVKIDGMKDYMKRLTGDENSPSVLHEETIKEEQLNIFAGYLPDKPAQPGHTWQRTVTRDSFDPTANFKADLAFTYKGKEDVAGKALDRIEAVWTVTFAAPKRDGVEIRSDLKAESAKATYLFDSGAGRLVRADRTFHVKGRAGVQLSEIDQEQTWRIRVTEENPLNR